jgi:hypothetical protein
MDGELAMPASNHSLRLTVIAPRASRSIARLILVVLALFAAGWSTAQAPRLSPAPTKNRSRPSHFHRSRFRGKWRSTIACSTTRVFRMTTPAAAIRVMTHRQTAQA